jgi:hypothetical protein
LKNHYPAIAKHLLPFEEKAKKRYDQGDYWWELRACDYYNLFGKPKIMYPVIAKEPRFAFDREGVYSNDKSFFIPCEDYYLLGILNSTLAWTFFKRICSVLGDPDNGGRLELRAIHVSQFPVKRIDSANTRDQALRKKLVSMVTSVLDLNEKLLLKKDSQLRTIISRQIDGTDRRIDQLVYELYGLTESEIAIVEGRKDT